MKKIPTLFLRETQGQPRRVINQVSPGCEWVLEGEGVPTRKLDGTCCLIRDGNLYRRHEVKPGKSIPDGFEQVDEDPVTGNKFGWVPVGDDPSDKWHREAWERKDRPRLDGTYELLGQKVQGNPEGVKQHGLFAHGLPIDDCERSFEGIRAFLEASDVEGIVWWHEDGRRAKIKKKDFGLKRA